MFAFPINLIVEVIKLYQLDKLLVVPFLMLRCTALGFVLRWFIAPPSFNLDLFSSNGSLFYVFFAYLFNFELKGKLAMPPFLCIMISGCAINDVITRFLLFFVDFILVFCVCTSDLNILVWNSFIVCLWVSIFLFLILLILLLFFLFDDFLSLVFNLNFFLFLYKSVFSFFNFLVHFLDIFFIMLDNDFVFELLVLFGHLIWVNWGLWILNDCCFLLGFFLCFSLLLFLLFLDLLFD